MDFDNFDLNEKEFEDIGEIIKKDLRHEGLEVEIITVTKKAYRIKVRIPKLLFDVELSPFVEQKILIQVDTVPQNFKYEPEKPFLNKFEVFTQINAVPKDILLAQKIYVSVNRKRTMGRDFFDIVFLYGIGAKPDIDYLKMNLNIKNITELKGYLLKKTEKFDFDRLAKDIEPLLFNPEDKKRVILFRDFIEKRNKNL